ncbi:glycosyltransferase family 4 protein [Desulfolucanica intricata]|uniref:glycosyltransferase family 4 protein n=1 Tax=Desulfolucanica intricata TaxID=1285191 RepID=UPI00082A2D49|nr:glycosyltransferase family 4 protein [Desulfolucanica intricata]
MKIGIFTDSYRPYTSGVVRSIETFTNELLKLGHDVYIFAPKYSHCENEERVFRFASIPAPTNPSYKLAVPFSLQFKSTIQKLQLDIIHVHSPFLLGRLGARYARKKNIPLVFTFHTLYDKYVHYVPFGQNITKEITQKICIDFCNNCDQVIVPTSIIGDYIKKFGVKCRIKKIPTGICLDDYANPNREWLRQKYKIPLEQKILLFVGRLGKEKNIHFLIKCFNKILNNIPNIHLVLVGSGPEEQELKKYALDVNIAENVTFTGSLSKTDVINSYFGSDLFVFTSITETQGLVIGEAKAAGLPVVAVNAFGVSEMVEDKEDGLLADFSEDDFVNKVLLLLTDDQLRKSMSVKARKNAEVISSVNCTLNLLDTYQNLIQNYALACNN